MRKKNFKGRCEKITVTKSKSICKTYDDLQRSYLEKLEANSDIQEIRMNIVLDSLPDYMSDFVCVKNDGGLMVRECVYRKFLTRLTLSGGDPLDNVELSYFVSKDFKNLYPEKELWIYTGYKYEEIIHRDKYKSLLKLCDVLVDGEFRIEEKDLRLQFRGSRNQRIIDVQKSIVANKIILWKRKEML